MTKEKDQKKNPLIREQPLTYDDYANLPDDGNRYELDDGVLELMSPAPSPRHQVIGLKLAQIIMNTCESEYILLTPPIDVLLSNREVRQPDLVMVHRSRASIITKRAIEGPPDLVAEILSPHSIRRDKQRKLASYAKHGIPEYWIIDPRNEVLERYVNADGKYELQDIFMQDEPVRSDRLPCVSFTVAQLMAAAALLPD
ncbi:Uma2 family endonuclease [Paenibacillus sp. HJGM_3]|uniref:Uma2 family endonuclease n=1 Tax=Paenibacillus sp. HJGM_3 TaxID=3379816 RepID=UPI00385B3A86